MIRTAGLRHGVVFGGTERKHSTAEVEVLEFDTRVGPVCQEPHQHVSVVSAKVRGDHTHAVHRGGNGVLTSQGEICEEP